MMTKKLLLKKMISDLVYRRDPESAKKGIRVLNYHSITNGIAKDDYYQMTTPKDVFEDQMRYLRENGYCVISCDEMADSIKTGIAPSKKIVCITFDDGFKDNLTNASPILEKYGFKATIFLTTDFIGKGGEWLNWDEVRLLSDMGIFSIGAHTLSHRRLWHVGPDDLHKEIGDSKKILEDRISKPVVLFAYPFGSYGSFDCDAVEEIKDKGYKAAFTTIAGINTPDTDPYMIKRTRISWFDDNREFAKELQGAYDWYRIWQKMTVSC